MRRVFVSADGSQTLAVEVAIRTSVPDAETRIDARVNQLVLYHGWLFGTIAGLGERAFRGRHHGGRAAEPGYGVPSQLDCCRGRADRAGYRPRARRPRGAHRRGAHVRGAERRHHRAWLLGHAQVAARKGPAGRAARRRQRPDQCREYGGGPGTTDTMVLLHAPERRPPWTGSTGPRRGGLSYLTLDVLIEVSGPTAANVVMEDFFAVSLDGREWPPVLARAGRACVPRSSPGLPCMAG